MSQRLKVRFAYQRGWQVVDGSAILSTFENKEDAFRFVLDLGARAWLNGGRTVIGGQSPPYDFAAQFQQDSVGRIMKRTHGSESGTWFWTCHEGGARGTVQTKEEAVIEVERAYTCRIVKTDWP
ncbi:hypothetical protein [Mesorhizobium sp. BHbdii]